MKTITTLLLIPVLITGCAVNATSSMKLYSTFVDFAQRNGIDLSKNRQYSEVYVQERADGYCGLLASQNYTKISAEISFPPVRAWRESPKDRSRLEVLIGDAGVLTRCPNQKNNWLRWRQVNAR